MPFDPPIFDAPELPEPAAASPELILLGAAVSHLSPTEFRGPAPRPTGGLPPELSDALGSPPDEPGPLVWVEPERFDFFDRHLLREATDHGLPLATRVSAGELAAIPAELFAETLLVARLPQADGAEATPLLDLLELGVPVVFYGPAAGAEPRVLERLGLAAAEPLSGPATLDLADEAVPLAHDPAVSAGPLSAVSLDVPGLVVRAAARRDGDSRVYACRLANAAWLRGSRPGSDGPDTSGWLLELAAELGWTIGGTPAAGPRRLALWRSDNALRLAGHWPAARELALATPDGAPLLTGSTTTLLDGAARYDVHGLFSESARVFVRQAGGSVACRALPKGGVRVTGLDEAVVTVRPPRDRLEAAEVDGAELGIEDEARAALVLFGVSGELTVKW